MGEETDMFNVADVARQVAAKAVAGLGRVRAALPRFTIVWVPPDDDYHQEAQRRVQAAADFATGVATGVGVSADGATGAAVYDATHAHRPHQ
jgi:hypothetical protein